MTDRAVPAASVDSPPSDEVELGDILSRRTDVPTVVVERKASVTGDVNGGDGTISALTPAPMASFEALSDVESDVDDEEETEEADTEGEQPSDDRGPDEEQALRDLATSLDIPSSSRPRRQTPRGSRDNMSRTAGAPASQPEYDGTSTGSDGGVNGIPVPPPPSPLTTAESSQRIVEEEEEEARDGGGAADADEDVEQNAGNADDDYRWMEGGDASDAAAGNVNIPTLVFDDFDEQRDSPTDATDVAAAEAAPVTTESTWAWHAAEAADEDQQDASCDTSWVTFGDDDDGDDSTRQRTAAAAAAADAETQQSLEADKPVRPPPPASRPQRPPPPSAQKPGDAAPTDPNVTTLPGIQYDPVFGEEYDDEDVAMTEKKKSKIKLSFSPKKIMKNIGKKDKSKKEHAAKEKAEKAKKKEAGSAIGSDAPAKNPETQTSSKTDSEDWKAFQAMQDRISQMVSKTSEKVSQLEQGFETELTKLNAMPETSPWTVIGVVDGSSGVDRGPQGSATPVKSPDVDETKGSWVGFDDAFDATALEADGAADEGAPEVEDAEKLVVLDSAPENEANDAAATEDRTADDAVARHFSEAAADDDDARAEKNEEEHPDDADDSFDPFVVTSHTFGAAAIDSRQPEADTAKTEQLVASTETADLEAKKIDEEDEEPDDDVDPFDVSDVVTAIASGKPLFEAIADEEKTRAPRKKSEERQSVSETAPVAESPSATGSSRARPRPRPQTQVKSANPFKISLAATSIGSTADDDEPVDEEYRVSYGSAAVTTSANPFARTSVGDDVFTSGTAEDSWDPFSSTLNRIAADDDDKAKDDETLPDFPAAATAPPSGRRNSRRSSAGSVASANEPEDEPPAEPLDPFYPKWDGSTGWSMFLRTPLKKKLTKNRTWKPVYVRLSTPAVDGSGGDEFARLRVFTNDSESVCLHELAIGPSYELRETELQQFDHFSKCHTVKLEQVSYVEKLALKGDRIAPTLGDLARVRDLRGLRDLMHKPKATMVLSHAAQPTESLKFGTLDYLGYRQFIRAVEDAMFARKMPARGKVSSTYTKDEIVVDLVDEYYADIDHDGHIGYHKARVRLFALAFLNGNPTIDVGINDRRRRGNEIVSRADIIPIKTEDWITYEDVELNRIVDAEEYARTRLIRFVPPDASRLELMRFRVRPRPNVELPLQIGVQMYVGERSVEIRADVMIPGYYSTSRRASQIPCEDIQIRFPIPENLVYMFRVEKRFRYGSIHSAKKKPGKIKGLERLTMFGGGGGGGGHGGHGGSGSGGTAAGTATPVVMQTSSGLAKYEHVFRSVVWRISRLPERNQGAYKTHLFLLKLELGPHDAPPTEYSKHVHVEYTMANSMVSRAQVRSISLSGQYYEEPPDRWVRHLARYEYTVEIEFTDQLKAPTQTDAPDLDELALRKSVDEEGAASPGAAVPATGGDSTADDSSDSSFDSD